MGFGLLGFRDEDLGVKETKVLGCGACGRLGIATQYACIFKRRLGRQNVVVMLTTFLNRPLPGLGLKVPNPGSVWVLPGCARSSVIKGFCGLRVRVEGVSREP